MMEPTTLLDFIFATIWDDCREYAVTAENFKNVSEDDLFPFFYKILEGKKCLPELKHVPTKSVIKAMEYRKLADDAFIKKSDMKAVRWYTRSAAVSLPESTELAFAFANRSAAHYRLGRFSASLIDMNRALQGGYPENLKLALIERKNKSIIQLKPLAETFGLPIRAALGNTSSSNLIFDSEAIDLDYRKKFPLPPEVEISDQLPYFHANIRIKHNSEFGRHFVAVQEIKPGETIGVEQPYASALSLKQKYTHCSNCYVRCEVLIPCPTCALLMFCSEDCKSDAWDRYHRVECEIIFYALHFDIEDDIWLAVRMLLIATEQGETLHSLMEHPVFGTPWLIDPTFIPTYANHWADYEIIHHSIDNANEASFEESYTFGFTAALIVHILKHSSFFDGTASGKEIVNTDLSPEEDFAGKLLLKFLFVVKHNSFRITETLRDDKNPIPTLNVPIGSSIYSFHSYFNHSCDENTANFYHKDVIVSRSVQLISPGDQIFLNYGLHYGMNYGNLSRELRSNYLQEAYKFNCNCQACKSDWPIMEDVGANFPRFKPKCIAPALFKVIYNKTRELRTKTSLVYDRSKLQHLCKNMEVYHRNVKKPWKEYYECQEKLKEIFSIDANFYHRDFDSLLMYL